MIFRQHYSGSSGNLYEITADGGERLLIDPGVTWKKLQRAIDYDLVGIQGCLLSHEHADHSKAVNEVIRAGIKVYSECETFTILNVEPNTHFHMAYIWDKKRFKVGCFDVMAFEIAHDAAKPLGFVIQADDESVLFATDTSHIKQKFNVAFDIICIECSYNKAILQQRIDDKDINETLAKRLLTSHMEASETMRYIDEFCDTSRLRAIHLLHMSKENIDQEATRKAFEEHFFVEVITA